MAAADRLFRAYGVAAVGVAALVAEADTAKATMYKAFGSKEGLLAAVLVKAADDMAQAFRADLAALAPDQRLPGAYRALIAQFCDAHRFGAYVLDAFFSADGAPEAPGARHMAALQLALTEAARTSAGPEDFARAALVIARGAAHAARTSGAQDFIATGEALYLRLLGDTQNAFQRQ